MLWYVVKIGKRGDFKMSSEKNELTEAQKRRKRIDLYKKIIITTIFLLIILPTILCIILFCKFSSLNNEIAALKMQLAGISQSDIHKNEITNELKPEELPTIPDNNYIETETVTKETDNPPVYSDTKKTEKELVDEAIKEGRKVVYLTYDDGPSRNTGKLLEILDRYGVKATFFLIKTPEYEEYIKQIAKEGHTVAMHTLTHDYLNVYANENSFKAEVDGIRDYLTGVTGECPFIFRFPGGSSNNQTRVPVSTYIKYLDSQNIVYFDWNVSSGDGGSGELKVEKIYNNVINGIQKNDVSVVLMHDSEYKGTTLEATPLIIEKLQEMKALILPITADTIPIHHNIN